MKVLHLLVVLTLTVSCKKSGLVMLGDAEFIDFIVREQYPDPSKVLIHDELGETISSDSLRILEATGDYFYDLYVNNQGDVVKLVIRKKKAADDLLLAKINAKLAEKNIPEVPVEKVDINCEDKAWLLNSVYEKDQGMRTGEGQIDLSVDHENLEIVLSLIEKCGIPSLGEVTKKGMAAIWLTLQHAPAQYQKMYIPELEELAERGDLRWEVIALMKDRALMYDNKPQIYGSQISNDTLYDLLEPELVDQRRAEMGMGPLADYLKGFDIEFLVEQVSK